jgi:transcription initiation factor TFIIA large subunit
VQLKQEDYKFDNTVKQEKHENDVGNYSPMNGYVAGGINTVASQRAAFHLQQRFGDQANASIQAAGLNTAQNRPIALPGQQPRPQHIQLPGQRPQAQYPHQSNQGPPQTDGAGDVNLDWQAIREDRQAHEGERVIVDGMLRRQLEQSMALTDSGLMMPRKERIRPKKGKASSRSQTLEDRSQAGPSSTSAVPSSIAQYDGPDSAKDEDEDAINSDLDDSDDELDAQQVGDDDGPLGETILCTYDKVQRVKNKVIHGQMSHISFLPISNPN